MLQRITQSLLILTVTATGFSASASLLWKDQTRFDRLKQERQQISLKEELKAIPAPKPKSIKAQQTVAISPYAGEESSKDIMEDVQRKKKAKKIIGALRGLSPDRFLEIFQMKKPDFSESNKDI